MQRGGIRHRAIQGKRANGHSEGQGRKNSDNDSGHALVRALFSSTITTCLRGERARQKVELGNSEREEGGLTLEGLCAPKGDSNARSPSARIHSNVIASARTICLAMSVLATMSLNSVKLSLPSPS